MGGGAELSRVSLSCRQANRINRIRSLAVTLPSSSTMSRRYDQSTTTFSPEGEPAIFIGVHILPPLSIYHFLICSIFPSLSISGNLMLIWWVFIGRLHQVEYAIEAINNAGTCIALQGETGIVLAAERKVVSKLLAPSKTSEKTYTIDKHVVCLVAGLTADANILINDARLSCQRYMYRYQEPIPVEQVVKHVCNHKQAYTQYGGLRPFGTAFLFAGYDPHFGFQLYQTDPSGNYSGWKATVIGQNNQAGKSILKTDYSENNALEQNLRVAIKILLKTMDSTAPSADRIELSTLTRDASGELVHRTLSDAEVGVLLTDIQAEVEREQKKAEASAGDS